MEINPKVFEANRIKIWQIGKDWYVEGDAGAIARCLRATRGQYIKVDGQTYDLEETAFYIAKHFNVRFAFEQIF